VYVFTNKTEQNNKKCSYLEVVHSAVPELTPLDLAPLLYPSCLSFIHMSEFPPYRSVPHTQIEPDSHPVSGRFVHISMAA